MSDEHKAALAVGRAEGRAVRAYLDALESNKPKRGRKRTEETIDSRLAAIDAEFDDAPALKRLELSQERRDLTAEKENFGAGVDIGAVEADFTKVAKGYAARKGISYWAFRDLGVPAAVLKKAGIERVG